jgi:hypothetical protein
MADYSTLAEYLLAVQRPDGGHLCRYGGNLNRIDNFPPNFTVTVASYPKFGSYCTIQWMAIISPHMIPDAFYYTTQQSGIVYAGGLLSEVAFGKGNIWLEVLESDPIITTLTNMTPLMQYYEFANLYLILQSEDDYKMYKNLVREWYASERVVSEKLDKTNEILARLEAYFQER